MARSERTMLFMCLLVAAVASVVPITRGLIPGSLIEPLLGIFRIQGMVFCSPNGRPSIGSNGPMPTPVLPNAKVQLRCGVGMGDVAGTVITNSNGTFSFMLDVSFFTQPQILLGCIVEVTIPPGGCNNGTLPPTGKFISTLIALGNTTYGQLPTVNIGVSGFNLVG